MNFAVGGFISLSWRELILQQQGEMVFMQVYNPANAVYLFHCIDSCLTYVILVNMTLKLA